MGSSILRSLVLLSSFQTAWHKEPLPSPSALCAPHKMCPGPPAQSRRVSWTLLVRSHAPPGRGALSFGVGPYALCLPFPPPYRQKRQQRPAFPSQSSLDPWGKSDSRGTLRPRPRMGWVAMPFPCWRRVARFSPASSPVASRLFITSAPRGRLPSSLGTVPRGHVEPRPGCSPPAWPAAPSPSTWHPARQRAQSGWWISRRGRDQAPPPQ